jgi:peptidoglycan hydrolase-like protein with peptidoglycan-binding domain
MSRLGIDYAWTHPALPAGCTFVLRYLSNDPSKNLTRGEADWLRSQGQDIGVVWETTEHEVDGGHAAGVAAAQRALAQAAAAGAPAGSVIYYAVDYDAQVGPIIRGYFQGVIEVHGTVATVGGYGGYHVLKALADAAVITWLWQAAAWSRDGAGNLIWDTARNHIEQYGGNQVFDWNRTNVANFGQWGGGGGVAPAPVDMHPGVRMLKVGDSGPDVAELQRCLGIVTDGSFGPATDTAVKDLQAAVGIGVDGICGPMTWISVVYGAIGDKYRAYGAAGSALGKPLMLEGGCPDGKGRFVHFEHGSIYYSPDTGAHVVLGGIRDRWSTIGWETSYVGYPTADEAPTVDGAGRFSRFQFGSIYYSPAGVAAVIHGDIYDHWASLNGESGILGYPTQDEVAAPDGVGRFQGFDHGVIYWTPGTGAHEVHGAILAAWAAEKWETGRLGYPTSDEHDTGTGGRVSSFQGGEIFVDHDGHVRCQGVTP